MIAYTALDMSGLCHKLARDLREAPLVERRGGFVREMDTPVLAGLWSPLNRLCLIPARKLNPWTTLAEFPWLMAGRNDVDWLLPYLPRAADFSDDGSTWRAGYGPRLRFWRGVVDQVNQVVRVLTKDSFTRQAVISLWDPAEDMPADTVTKDFPCTNWFHFMRRRDQLDLIVSMRSNDFIWGFSGVNVVNFTLLLELVASCSGLKVGTYWHMASNLHVYQRHFTVLENLREPYHVHAFEQTPAFVDEMPGEAALAHHTNLMIRCLHEVHVRRSMNQAWRSVTPHKDLAESLNKWVRSADPSFYVDWCYFMLLHKVRDDLGSDWALWEEALGPVSNPEWRAAVFNYVEARNG